MEDKRGFSLRQKKAHRRPAISAPKQLSNQSTTAPPLSQASSRTNGLSEKPTNISRERPDRPGEKTADLVKRRYSTRFAQLPDFNNADAPPLPNGHVAGEDPKLNIPAQGSAQSLNVDVAALKDPNLDPEKCRPSRLLASFILTVVWCRFYDCSCGCLRPTAPGLSDKPSKTQEPSIYRPATECLPKPNPIHQDQQRCGEA